MTHDDRGYHENVLYSQNVFFVHNETKLTFKIKEKEKDAKIIHNHTNSSDEERDDKLVVPSFAHDAVTNREGYRLERVSKNEVRDILFIRKFLSIGRKCVSAVQEVQMDQLYLPLFRHWQVLSITSTSYTHILSI